ncbi:MAG: hypothetical protein ACLURQ_15245 [Bacteroides thetaiotaomicron]
MAEAILSAVSSFLLAQNKRYLPQGGKLYYPFGERIITSLVSIRNKCRTSSVPLTCSVMTSNRTGRQGISCISQPSRKANLDNREQIKARREVDNVVEGHYDQQQKKGFSMRR